MSSASSYSHLPAPSAQLGKRTHRHRRSGAISGNFDAVGLGLFSPPPPLSGNSARHSPHSLNSSPHTSSRGGHYYLFLSLAIDSSNSEGDVLDWHFHFCNEEDFSNKPTDNDFEFPSKLTNSPALPFLSPAVPLALRRLSGGSSALNSPIRLRNRKSVSSMSTTTPKLFLTDETVMDKDNVPDALIDLDEILNPSNMLTSDRVEPLAGAEPRSFLDLVDEAGLLPQSRSHAPASSSFSPYSSPAYVKQPIREPADRAIVEEDVEETVLDVPAVPGFHSKRTSSTLPQPTPSASASTGELYELSVNSSSSSLPSMDLGSQRNTSATLWENSMSNSSRDSSYSGLFFVRSNSTKKSSGAKSSRYQTFYDQSLKVSFALKNSSAENVSSLNCLVASNPTRYDSASQPQNVNGLNLLSKHDGLGYSSSMPSLRLGGSAGSGARSLGNSGASLDVHARDPKLLFQQGRMQEVSSRNPLVTAHKDLFSYRGNSKLGLTVEADSSPVKAQCYPEKLKDLSDKKYTPVGWNKPPVDVSLLSRRSIYSEGHSTINTAGDHGSDHSSLARKPEIITSAFKADHILSRSVTPVVMVDNSVSSQPPSRASPVLTKSVTQRQLQLEMVPDVDAVPFISPTHEQVLQTAKIPPYSPKKGTKLDKSEKVRVIDLMPSSSVKSDRTHKRTGSGHRLLSNWFRR